MEERRFKERNPAEDWIYALDRLGMIVGEDLQNVMDSEDPSARGTYFTKKFKAKELSRGDIDMFIKWEKRQLTKSDLDEHLKGLRAQSTINESQKELFNFLKTKVQDSSEIKEALEKAEAAGPFERFKKEIKDLGVVKDPANLNDRDREIYFFANSGTGPSVIKKLQERLAEELNEDQKDLTEYLLSQQVERQR